MKNAASPFPATRREFIKSTGAGIGLLALGNFAPAFLAQSVRANVPAPERDRSILVVIQLGGGNDGLNTVVPHADDQYYRLRPTIGLKRDQLIPLNDTLSFHASCAELASLFKEGQLGIIQNVGYPNPNRSHFRSTEIWETASDSRDFLATGWIGRYLDNCCSGSPSEDPLAVNIGNELPDAFLCESEANVYSFSGRTGRSSKASAALLKGLQAARYDAHSSAGFLQQTAMNALVTDQRVLSRIRNYKSDTAYPSHPLAQSLRHVAAMIASGQETRVYFVPHSGFDTHANQLQRHSQLLKQLSSSMAAFQQDLASKGLSDQVLTMTFSEFGRRPSENQSSGTDHGTAAPLFVMGSQLQAGLHGQPPSLQVEKNQDLAFDIDFRRVYSEVVDRWLQGDSQKALPGPFAPIGFLS